MCTVKLLQTKKGRINNLQKREEGNDCMSYLQIQYYNDCIRAYATKIKKPVDVAFCMIESANLLHVIESSYKENLKVFMAVRRMQTFLNSYATVSRNR